MKREELNRLLTLCGAVRDGMITEEEFTELDALLRHDPEAQSYYLDYIYLCTDLCNLQAAIKHASARKTDRRRGEPACSDGADSPLTLEMLKALGEYEKEAEVLEMPEPDKPRKRVVNKALIESRPRPVSKLSIVTFVASLAALLIVLVYIHLNPRVSFEVATLTGSVKARWSSSLPLEQGLRLPVSSDTIHLQEGVIEMESDKGVTIMLEAPAGFFFRSPDEIHLDYGRAYARVPKSGSGFSIQTGNSKIIDLGTEFGVHADTRGETELHVFQGNTVLITGSKSKPQKTMEVPAGKAMRVSYSDGRVTDIELSSRMFVQQIDPSLGLIWRGDRVLNLADTVGGGDGMGTGKINAGLYPSNRDGDKPGERRDRKSSNHYNPVPGNPFVDGVFVPDGTTPQIVTSAGHRFSECPATSGFFFADITNTDSNTIRLNQDGLFSADPNNADARGDDLSFIFLHANGGITFDLTGFRRHLPGIEILRFRSTLGIPKNTEGNPVESRAEFWVLVDGAVRYRRMMTPGMYEPIEIELKRTDRFLTLITTDGGSLKPEEDRNAIGHDGGVFANPVLVLK